MSARKVRAARIVKTVRIRSRQYEADLRSNFALMVEIYNDFEPSVAAVETPKEQEQKK